MFRRTRWWMVGWTVLVVTLLIVLLGTILYQVVSNAVVQAIDDSLVTQGEQTEDALAAVGAGQQAESGQEGYRGGVFYLVLNGNGQSVVNPQGVDAAQLFGGQWPPAAGARTMAGSDGMPTRVLVRPLADPSAAPSDLTLVIGQSLAPTMATLRALSGTLLVVGGVGALLAFASAWFWPAGL